MKVYTGNYSFWSEVSKIAEEQQKNQNKRIEAKREELLSFIQRFSANASKSKQATSRKNLLEKLQVEDYEPSSRRYPHISFKPNREIGDKVLEIKELSKSNEGTLFFKDLSLTVEKGDKIAFIGNKLAISALFDIISGETKADTGTFQWGITTSQAYFPKENSKYFLNSLNLIDWLRQFSPKDQQDENFIRGFLGKMLFSGEETLKQTSVLSGGEKVRCMFSKMMLSGSNVIILDEPTNHLDIESISALNQGVINTKCVVLFASQDFEFTNTVTNRVVEILPKGIIDRRMKYEEFIFDPQIKSLRETLS
jgi:ATPase subunit of ABC transporter with duplicated ATPase domains